MKTLIKTTILSLTLLCQQIFAAGIPTVDGSAIAQNMQNHLAHMAEVARQIAEAQAQLEQLKANVNALTGNKGFSDIMKLGGVDPEILSTFEDLLKGNTSGLTEKAKSYLSELPNTCTNARDKSMCEQVSLGAIAQMDYAEKLNQQLVNKLKTITELSERAKQAKDMKSMSELQTQIALEANSLSVLQIQADNFEKFQRAQAKIVAQQKREQEVEKRWEIIASEKHRTTEKVNFNNLFKQ